VAIRHRIEHEDRGRMKRLRDGADRLSLLLEPVHAASLAEGDVLQAEALPEQPLEEVETALQPPGCLVPLVPHAPPHAASQQGPQAAAFEPSGQVLESSAVHGNPPFRAARLHTPP
jgi:hypothetical protein